MDDAQFGSSEPPFGQVGSASRYQTPACMVCGRSDETVRLVSLPYVISLLVVTFRRAFVGVWCWRHRLQRTASAGVISALFGWLGIPYGFLYTPLALLKLARGGDQPLDENIHLLQQIGDAKAHAGESEAAIRAYQEILKLRDDAELRLQLRELHDQFPLTTEEEPGGGALMYFLSLVGFSLTGALAGFFDFLIVLLLGAARPGEAPIYVAILTWAPLLALAFLAGLALVWGMEWVLEHTRTRLPFLGTTYAILAALATGYGLPMGRVSGEYIAAVVDGLPFNSFGDVIGTTISVVTQGGFWFLGDALRGDEPFGLIYLLIFLATLAFYLYLALRTASNMVDWQVRLALFDRRFATEGTRSHTAEWIGVGVFATLVLILNLSFIGRDRMLAADPQAVAFAERGNALFAQGDLEGAAEAFQQAAAFAPSDASLPDSLGWVYYSMGELEQAESAFHAALQLEPDWGDPHLGLGNVAIARDDALGARLEFETVLTLLPEDTLAAQAYDGLGLLAMEANDYDLARSSFEQAVALDWGMASAHLGLGFIHLAMGDFDAAIDKGNTLIGIAPDWGAPHALLASAYDQKGEQESAERELSWAEDTRSKDATSMQLLAAAYWEMNRFDDARRVLDEAHDLYPGDDRTALTLARLMALQGEGDAARSLAEMVRLRSPLEPDAYAVLGLIALEAQDLQAAHAWLIQAKEINPQDWFTLSYLSFVEFQRGNIDAAFEAGQAALDQFVYDPRPHTFLAFAQRARGDVEGAAASARRAIHLSPKYDLAHFILGTCLVDLGDQAGAREELARFVELSYDRAYVREFVQQAQAYLDATQIP